MKKNRYKPVRIIAPISVIAKDDDELREKYPNGIRDGIPQKYRLGNVSSVQVTYKPGTVIDAPTDAERRLFDIKVNGVMKVGAAIPQLEPGVDDPKSGLARHPRTAMKGYNKFLSTLPAELPKPENKKKHKTKSEKVEPSN